MNWEFFVAAFCFCFLVIVVGSAIVGVWNYIEQYLDGWAERWVKVFFICFVVAMFLTSFDKVMRP